MNKLICYDRIRIAWQRGLLFYLSVALMLFINGFFGVKRSLIDQWPYEGLISQPMDSNFLRWIAVPSFLVLTYLLRSYFTNLEQVRISIERQCRYKWIILLISLGMIFLMSEGIVLLDLIWTKEKFILLDILYAAVQQSLILSIFGVICHLLESIVKYRFLALLIGLGLSPLLFIVILKQVFLFFIEESDPLTWMGLVFILLKMGFILYPAYQLDRYLMHQRQYMI